MKGRPYMAVLENKENAAREGGVPYILMAGSWWL